MPNLFDHHPPTAFHTKSKTHLNNRPTQSERGQIGARASCPRTINTNKPLNPHPTDLNLLKVLKVLKVLIITTNHKTTKKGAQITCAPH